MTLRNDEYKIKNNGIWISKDILEKWRDHYKNLANIANDTGFGLICGVYIGKSDVLIDLLKLFEPLEG